MIQGRIHSIETFGSVDGPGTRFIIFLQGCAMRCLYCHNVDTWNGQRGGELRTADELLDQAERYRPYWGDEGGITVSGGEPLLQMDFLLDLLRKAKARGMHTCIDTAGQPFTRWEPFFSKFQALMEVTDLLLVDIKHIDAEAHQKLTGCPNDNIRDMFCYLSSIHKPIWVRQVLVPGWTDAPDSLRRTRSFLDTLTNVERVEVLPYHNMGLYKWDEFGIPNQLRDVQPPSEEDVQQARDILGAV